MWQNSPKSTCKLCTIIRTNNFLLAFMMTIPSFHITLFIVLKLLDVLSCRIYIGWWNFAFGFGWFAFYSLSFPKVTQTCFTICWTFCKSKVIYRLANLAVGKITIFCFSSKAPPVRIQVRISPQHPLAFHKRWLNGAGLHSVKPRPRVTAGVTR
jgi:hypothetical protein